MEKFTFIILQYLEKYIDVDKQETPIINKKTQIIDENFFIKPLKIGHIFSNKLSSVIILDRIQIGNSNSECYFCFEVKNLKEQKNQEKYNFLFGKQELNIKNKNDCIFHDQLKLNLIKNCFFQDNYVFYCMQIYGPSIKNLMIQELQKNQKVNEVYLQKIADFLYIQFDILKKNNIIHTDIKFDNILIKGQDQITLLVNFLNSKQLDFQIKPQNQKLVCFFNFDDIQNNYFQFTSQKEFEICFKKYIEPKSQKWLGCFPFQNQIDLKELILIDFGNSVFYDQKSPHFIQYSIYFVQPAEIIFKLPLSFSYDLFCVGMFLYKYLNLKQKLTFQIEIDDNITTLFSFCFFECQIDEFNRFFFQFDDKYLVNYFHSFDENKFKIDLNEQNRLFLKEPFYLICKKNYQENFENFFLSNIFSEHIKSLVRIDPQQRSIKQLLLQK